MKKEVKATVIQELSEIVDQYPHFYVVDVIGMDAASTSAMRRKAFEMNVKMVVVKNTLLRKALETKEVDFTPIYDSLKGTSALLLSEVANVPAKLIKAVAQDGIPALKAAYAEEGFYVGADNLSVLSAIKSKNEVIAEVIALLQSPAKNVVSALQSGGQTIHGVLKTLGDRPE